MNKDQQRHLGNISRLVGHDVSNRYSYIISESDLINAWLQMHNDLNYPLMMTSKNRRALIYNKPGLEKMIQEELIKQMERSFKELENIVTKDIENQLNSIIQMPNGCIVLGKSGSQLNSTINLFTNAAAKGLVNGLLNILDDITSYDDDYKRR